MGRVRRNRALPFCLIFGCDTAPEVRWPQSRLLLMFSSAVWSLLFKKSTWLCVVQAKTWGTRVFHGELRKPLVAETQPFTQTYLFLEK